VADACTVHGADIRAVLYALVRLIVREIANSKNIKLGDLGNLRIEVKSEGVATIEEVSKEMIKKARVVFTPGKLIKKMLKTLEFKIVIEEEEA
jgi:predicted histone-like DNA-binding protein